VILKVSRGLHLANVQQLARSAMLDGRDLLGAAGL